MATKKTPRTKRAAKTATRKAPASEAARSEQQAGNFRAKIRMYRQGLGDCFLITLPKADGSPFYFLIDCGVILGTKLPGEIMTKVVDDIVATTGGHVDVLAATHEHWDHLSGFVQARDSFRQLAVEQVWLAWTEDPKDALANKLRGEGTAMRAALAVAEARMRFGGAAEAASEVRGMLDFFGAAGDNTTSAALKFVHKMSSQVRFCLASDGPRELGDTGVRSFVLGPPHDEKMIKRFNPSKSHPETYGMDSMNLFMSSVAPALTPEDDDGRPFNSLIEIPLEAAGQAHFFQDHYWGEDANSSERDQSWRTIETSWLDSSATLALQLDSATNNTSLVLAFELTGGTSFCSRPTPKWATGFPGRILPGGFPTEPRHLART